jgi:hypothetical protein
VVRLGRGVQTQTAVARSDLVGEQPRLAATESGSGVRPSTDIPTVDQLAGSSAHREPDPDLHETGVGSDRYDLVITAAEPCTLGWFCPADWADLLTQTGTLAVITHGDRSAGRLTDPADSLVRAGSHAGLHYFDRIALLRTRIRDSALSVGGSAVQARSQTAPRPLGTLVRHVQVHDELLVFSRQPALTMAADGQERSDA